MEGITLYGGDAGSGASSSSKEPSLPDLNLTPAAEEDPGARSDIERALDQRELAKIQDQKVLFYPSELARYRYLNSS